MAPPPLGRGDAQELNRTNRIDCSNLTRDQALFKSFDEVVRRQLDPVWNTVSRKTKQLVCGESLHCGTNFPPALSLGS